MAEEYNAFTNPAPPTDTRKFATDPMARAVKDWLAGLLPTAEANLDKNIQAYTPKPTEDARTKEFGGLRAPRIGDDPTDAGIFVMAGPIAVEQALAKLPKKLMSPEAMESWLTQKAGASKAELEAMGMPDYLKKTAAERTRFSPKGVVHTDEALEFARANPVKVEETVRSGELPSVKLKRAAEIDDEITAIRREMRTGPAQNPERLLELEVEKDKLLAGQNELRPKFARWQLPGGENYREVLLRAPATEPQETLPAGWKIAAASEQEGMLSIYDAQGVEVTSGRTERELLDNLEEGMPSALGSGFRAGHWDEPNVIAHMRLNDRTLPSGERALHVEEFQSDWALQLRQEAAEKKAIDPSLPVNPPFIKGHPLVENWQDLSAKRALKEAADGDYDRLTWITGEQTAERYDLSKTFKEISYEKNPNGTYTLRGLYTQGGEEDAIELARAVAQEKLADHVGKDVAKKIIAGEGIKHEGGKLHVLSNLDLKVGGEWATKLYDRDMVNRFNKIGKKWGVKVEDTPLGATEVDAAAVRRAFDKAVEQDRYLESGDIPVAIEAFLKQVETGEIASKQQAIDAMGKIGSEFKLGDYELEQIGNIVDRTFTTSQLPVGLSNSAFDIEQRLGEIWGERRGASRVLDRLHEVFNHEGNTPDQARKVVDELAEYAESWRDERAIPQIRELGAQIEEWALNTKVAGKVHSLRLTPEMKAAIKAQPFHPFADYVPSSEYYGLKKVPGGPSAAKAVPAKGADYSFLQANPTIKYVGEQMGHPMYQEEPPGVGSFMVKPGETVSQAYERAKKRFSGGQP